MGGDDEERVIDAAVWLALRVDGAAADFWKVILGKEPSIYAPTLDEFLAQATKGEAAKDIAATEAFVKPFDKPTLMPVFTDAARVEYRKVTWWKGVGVGPNVYVFYCTMNVERAQFDDDKNARSKFAPSGKHGHWRLATRFARRILEAGPRSSGSWDVTRTLTYKTMDVVAAKYTIPAAIDRINQGLDLLDATARFIPAYAGVSDLVNGKTTWDKGVGVILIAADLIPLAGSVRNASKVVKIGSQSFIAIGAGTRIINGVKQAMEGTANLGTGVDVVMAVVEGTVYAMSRVNLKLRIRGKEAPTDVIDLVSILNTKPDAKTPRPILVADDASAERLAGFFKNRTAADIKKQGLSPEELIEMLDANPNAVKAQMSRSEIKGRYQDGIPAQSDHVVPSRLDFDTADASYWEAGKVLKKLDEKTGRTYQHRICAKDLQGQKVIIDIDLSDHLHGAHKAPHYHIYTWKSGSWSKKGVTPSAGQPGFPDVRDGIYIGPTQKSPE